MALADKLLWLRMNADLTVYVAGQHIPYDEFAALLDVMSRAHSEQACAHAYNAWRSNCTCSQQPQHMAEPISESVASRKAARAGNVSPARKGVCSRPRHAANAGTVGHRFDGIDLESRQVKRDRAAMEIKPAKRSIATKPGKPESFFTKWENVIKKI
jgi:hypothetical protein